MGKPSNDERRNYVRINPPLIAMFRVLDEPQKKSKKNNSQVKSQKIDKEVINHLDEINEKLNRIINLVDRNNESASEDIKCAVINLSGNGVRIVSKQNLSVDSTLDMHIEIPDPYHYILILVGKVIWCNELTNGLKRNNRLYEIGVEFSEIDPDDQDILIRYIFAEQRKICKRRKDV